VFLESFSNSFAIYFNYCFVVIIVNYVVIEVKFQIANFVTNLEKIKF